MGRMSLSSKAKTCGDDHNDHDWGEDGICRRCGAHWQCLPHWWRINKYNVGRCRFCPAERDFLALQGKGNYAAEMRQMKELLGEAKKRRKKK